MPARALPRRPALLAAFGVALIVASVGLLATVTAQAAAAGCRVVYSVPSQWPGGFTGSVAMTNLGDPLNGWRVGWTFASGQQVVQAWNAVSTQSGANVTMTNASYNPALGSNTTVTFGFNGTFPTSNVAPTAFTLNGVACTGSTTGTTTATVPPTTTPTTTPTVGPTVTPTTAPPSNAWNPPASLVTGLNEVWAHQESTYSDLYGFRNYGWDQVMVGRGTINYCVRWDSTAHVTATQRDQVGATLSRQFNKWMTAMTVNGQGWNAWPYPTVNVKVVGWAVRDRSQLEWSDNSVDVYVNNIRENAPQCSEPCGRFFHQDGNYAGCPGGAAHHYDMSLWLTAGFGGGAGGDWGQRIGSEYYMGALNADNVHILLHEMGHTFGLDDFYDWTPTGVTNFIMKAGSATQITEFDKWMLRDWWRHLKSRYGL
jgi:Cellulose binding domain